ncbi:hypothetical protein TRFO_04556 [Tritrichomonas foetus]|uniref:Uncharacterized protein n=1 Tax=Tritrichomonas foetus TaxID=1144522 RepID=A0A1J4KEN6_9EUKA|nr:hypothetical protein TRFO_04556 [Tritrichomonas foetus]|eukprot:OHT09474.1 hypothetical protein TRFO_04556 [Tritrichomonas foetus]
MISRQVLEEFLRLKRAQKPRRKTVKKKIAASIEKLVEPAQIKQNVVQSQTLSPTKVNNDEIDQVCNCRYYNDNQTEGQNGTKPYFETLEAFHKKYDITETISSTTEFLALMSVSLPILKEALADPDFEHIHNDIKKSEVEWLVRFIDMILSRKSVVGLEQNISITYFSCFLPMFKKLNNEQEIFPQIPPVTNDSDGADDGFFGFDWGFE